MSKNPTVSVLALGLSAFCPAQIATAPPRQELEVVFVGDLGDARGAAYAAFLRQRFTTVRTAERSTFDPAKVGAADVVLLDWPQSEGARKMRETGKTPLGAREDWITPTVLLGSAGLNVATAWGYRGSWG